MILATINKRYQVVIPSAIRRQLKLRPRSKVTLSVVGDELVLRPVNGIASMRGIGRDLRDGEDATDYVRRLRDEWDQRLMET